MKIIYNERYNKEILVDDDNFDYINQFTWSIIEDGSRFYAITPWINENKNKTTMKMHRLIIRPKTQKKYVDHIDGNGLNNTRINLRVCSSGENMRNRNKQINNTSGYKGVTWHKKDKKWQAQLLINRKLKYLGSFTEVEDAARAYDEGAKKWFGEFAKLNFKE